MIKLYEMDIQLFAAPENLQLQTTSASLNTNTTDALSVEMKTFYDMELIKNAEPELVHDQFAQKRPIPRNGGKTIEFRKFSSLPKATTPLVEGVTPSGQSLDVTSLTATVDQFGGYVTLSDMLTFTAIDNNIVEATQLIGSQAGRTLDTVTREKINAGTNVMFAPKISAEGAETEVFDKKDLDQTAKLTPDLIFKAVNELKRKNVKPFEGGSYVCIIHPDIELDIMLSDAWKDVTKYARPDQLFKGEIGMLGNCRFVETTEAKIFKGAPLASDSETLLVNMASGASSATTVAFDGGTVAADALKGRYVIINGTKSLVTTNTTKALTLETAITCDDNTVIYPGEGGAEGLAVYSCLFIGQNAYATTEVEGEGLKTIIKQLGSGGTADPIDQRATIGWKGLKTSCILSEEALLRVMCCSSLSNRAEGN